MLTPHGCTSKRDEKESLWVCAWYPRLLTYIGSRISASKISPCERFLSPFQFLSPSY